jgi:hypothetical protein
VPRSGLEQNLFHLEHFCSRVQPLTPAARSTWPADAQGSPQRPQQPEHVRCAGEELLGFLRLTQQSHFSMRGGGAMHVILAAPCKSRCSVTQVCLQLNQLSNVVFNRRTSNVDFNTSTWFCNTSTWFKQLLHGARSTQIDAGHVVTARQNFEGGYVARKLAGRLRRLAMHASRIALPPPPPPPAAAAHRTLHACQPRRPSHATLHGGSGYLQTCSFSTY